MDVWMPGTRLFNWLLSLSYAPQIFELVTSRGLFKYEPDSKLKLDETEHILYQMICYTSEDFSPEQLSVSPLAGRYFDSTCQLFHFLATTTSAELRQCHRRQPKG